MTISKYATTFDRIEEIMKQITALEYTINDGETIEVYKKRVESLHQPLISQLEGVKLEWKVPDYTSFKEDFGFTPENEGEEVLHINTDASPVKDIISSVLSLLSVKEKLNT